MVGMYFDNRIYLVVPWVTTTQVGLGTSLVVHWLRILFWTSLVAQMVKSLPAVQETLVQSLTQEDPLVEETATESSILA